VPEQNLDGAQVSAALQKVSGEAMPHHVKGNALLQAGMTCRFGAGTPESYQEMAAEENPLHLESLARDFLRDVRVAQSLIILKTDPGHASPIAVALDNEDWDEVLGTIAGDDTVLVIAGDTATAKMAKTRLLRILEP
jgi:arginine repressor